MERRKRVAVGSDTRHATADAVAAHLEANGHAVLRCGAAGGDDTPWPDVAEEVARLVASRGVDTAVLCCWTGTGVTIAANKVPGVRAALCADADTARGARRWNDANVLTIGLANTEPSAATGIVDAWLDTDDVDPDEVRNIERVAELEHRYGVQQPSARSR
ncbi:MAG: RpiB/LacA/LacB family sugar-phosphate isomerase [Candidatus Dormibacteraeota bacterium]|nr:RpiB/LacA/LacB family sugar-phosphate isomerase [Candidatus Dormibacteraeota bacterium]